MSKPRILAWDLETGFNLLRAFSLYFRSGRLPHTAIESERYIISGSFKWLGNKGKPENINLGQFARWRKDPTDDRHVVRGIHAKLSQADAIVAHYGDGFDLKFFNGRALIHGLKPIHNVVQIDTYKIAKKHFLLNSNKLDYLGKVLGFGGKIHTSEGLWEDCMKGDDKALNKMVRYNDQDVELLEKVYLALRPYATAKLNMGLFAEDDTAVCPACGSDNVHQRGYYYTRTGKTAKFQCQDCGHWGHSRVSEKKRPVLK